MQTKNPDEIINEIRQDLINKSFYTDSKGKRQINDLVQKTLQRLTKLGTIDIYSEDFHFIFELLQNADDNEYDQKSLPSISFNLIKEKIIERHNNNFYLHVINNEKGFSEENVRALCDVNNSSKKNKELGYIGEKGIGFKAVFKVTKDPHVFSNGYNIHFPEKNDETELGYFVPKIIAKIPEKIRKEINNTNILLPLKEDRHYKIIEDALKYKIKEEVLLFLRHVKNIQININNLYNESYTISTEISNKLYSLASKEYKKYYWIFNYRVTGLSKVDEPKRKISENDQRTIDQRPLTLAFPIFNDRINGKTYCFLPTKVDSGLPFIINADFILTTDRDTIDFNNEWNLLMRASIAKAFIEWFVDISTYYSQYVNKPLSEIIDKNNLHYFYYDYIPLKKYFDSINDENLIDFFTPVYDEIVTSLSKKKVVLGINNKLYMSENVIILSQQQEKLLLVDLKNLPQYLLENTPIKHEIKKYEAKLKEIGCTNLNDENFLECLKDSEWLSKRNSEWFYNLYTYLEEKDFEKSDISEIDIVLLETNNTVNSNETIFFPDTSQTSIYKLLTSVNSININIFNSKLFKLCNSSKNNKIINWLEEVFDIKKMNITNFIEYSLLDNLSNCKFTNDEIIEISNFLKDSIEEWGKNDNLVELIKSKIVIIDSSGKQIKNAKFMVFPENLDVDNGWQYFLSDNEDRKHLSILNNNYVIKYNDEDDIEGWTTFFKKIGILQFPPPPYKKYSNQRDKVNLTKNEAQIFSEIYYLSEDNSFENYKSPKWLTNKITSDNDLGIKSMINWMNIIAKRNIYNLKEKLFFESYHNYTVQRGYGRNKYYSLDKKTYQSDFFLTLINTKWVPTTKGYKMPSETFINDDIIKNLYGNEVPYLTIPIDIEICKLLGIIHNLSHQSVLKYLKTISKQNISKENIKLIENIYKWLGMSENTDFSDVILSENLILLDIKNNIWGNAERAIWADLSDLFDDNFYYLENIYSKELKDFFLNKLNINETPDIEKYAIIWHNISENNIKDINKLKKQLTLIYQQFSNEFSDDEISPSDFEWWDEFRKNLKIFTHPNNVFMNIGNTLFFDDVAISELFSDVFHPVWLPDKFPSNNKRIFLDLFEIDIVSKNLRKELSHHNVLASGNITPLFFTEGFKKGLFYSVISQINKKKFDIAIERLTTILKSKEVLCDKLAVKYVLYSESKEIKNITNFYDLENDISPCLYLVNGSYNEQKLLIELSKQICQFITKDFSNKDIGALNKDLIEKFFSKDINTADELISLEELDIDDESVQIYISIVNNINGGEYNQKIDSSNSVPQPADGINDSNKQNNNDLGSDDDNNQNNATDDGKPNSSGDANEDTDGENDDSLSSDDETDDDNENQNKGSGSGKHKPPAQGDDPKKGKGGDKPNSSSDDGEGSDDEDDDGLGSDDETDDDDENQNKGSGSGKRKPPAQGDGQKKGKGGSKPNSSSDDGEDSDDEDDDSLGSDGETDDDDENQNKGSGSGKRKPPAQGDGQKKGKGGSMPNSSDNDGEDSDDENDDEKSSGHNNKRKGRRQTDQDYINKLNKERESKENEIEKRKKIIELKNKIKSLTKYSFEWFNEMIELEYLIHESTYNTENIKINFFKIDKISNNLIILKNPSRYIPSNIEDIGGLQLRIYSGKHKFDLKVDVVSNKDNALKVKLINKFQLETIKFKGAKAELEIKNLLFILEALKNNFKEMEYENHEIVSIPSHKVKYIFGPPGTGKTTKLSDDIIKLMSNSEPLNVLALAPTNKAADVLVRKIIKQNNDKIPNWLIRFGNTGDSFIENNPQILKDKNYDIIGNAFNVVVTTIARFPYDGFNNNDLKSIHWDYVIFDESSMIFLPAIVYAITTLNESAKEIIIGGDPFQIQPIVLAEEWENQNIYSFVKLESFEPSKYPVDIYNNVIPLTTQYRSISTIGTLFSNYKYDGILKHYRSADKKILAIDNVKFSDINIIGYPFKRDKLHKSEKIKKSSYHLYSAIFAVELIIKIVKELENKWGIKSDNTNHSQVILNETDDFNIEDINKFKWTIGVISPYKAQAMVIEKLLSAAIKERNNVCVIPGTVHGFQGDECDIIIAVLNSPSEVPNDKAFINNENIINVAISRAKDCLMLLVPSSNIQNFEQINKIVKIIKNDIGKGYLEIKSSEIEKLIFNNSKYIKDNTFITSHQSVNVYSEPHYKYEIRTKAEDSIDIFVNDVSNENIINDTVKEQGHDLQEENDELTLEDYLSLIDSHYAPIAKHIFEKKLNIPTPGYELTNKNGKILANSEFAWPDLKIALLTDDDLENKQEFEKQGWTVFALSEILKSLDNIETILQ